MSARNPFSVEKEGNDERLQRQSKFRSASTGSLHSHTMSLLGSLEPLSPSSTRNSSPRSRRSSSNAATVTDQRSTDDEILGSLGQTAIHRDKTDQSSTDDEILGSLAQTAMHKVKSMALGAFHSGGWTECKGTANEHVFEQKSPSAFSIIAKSLVPCTVDEFSSVLSCTDSDQFNASMLEICGAQYAYGVTVRAVPTSAPESHLSIKTISFSSANPLSSTKRTANFLDYVDADVAQRSACRMMHTLARTRNFDIDERQSALGDVLVGYILQEEPESRQSTVFFYATHFARGPGASLRPGTLYRLRRMVQVNAKWVAIATRRRLGTHKILDRAPSDARSPSCAVCVQAFSRLALRTKHFCRLCGQIVCGSCSRSEEVEEHIGIVDKVRVCVSCSADARQQAFERSEAQRWEYCNELQRQQVERAMIQASQGKRGTEGHSIDEEDVEGPCRPYLIV